MTNGNMNHGHALIDAQYCQGVKEMKESSSEEMLQPPRQFWRRLFRHNSSSKRFRRKATPSEEDIRSQASTGSSCQSGSDDSESSQGLSKDQRVSRYLSVDTTRPFTLIANYGDLNFQGLSDGGDEFEDDYELMKGLAECRDDIGLLEDCGKMKSHLMRTPTAQRRAETEDRVALLSEHDDLVEIRRGSYYLDIIDPLAISGTDALQKLSLLTLHQEVVDYEESMKLEEEAMKHETENIPLLMNTPFNEEPKQEFVPLQITFPSGETKGEGIKSQPQSTAIVATARVVSVTTRKVKVAPAPTAERALVKKNTDTTVDSTSDDLSDEETPAFSAIIQDRTQRHKAYYLLRLKNSQQKKKDANPRSSAHGDLWTLTELPSEDECTSFSRGQLEQMDSGFSSWSGVCSYGSKQTRRMV
jgi:hypothetical protein